MISSPRQAPTLQEIHYNSPSRTHTLLNSENEDFCSKSNIEESLRYLDQELQMLGLQTLYNSNGVFDLTKLVNVAYKLFRKCQQASRYREELEIRVQRNTADLEHSQSMAKRLRQSNKSLQSTIGKQEETERQMRLERASIQMKLKLEQDQVRKLKSLLQSTENQHKHENKKREKQLMALKERAQQLLTDKNKSASSIEISRCLTRQDGRRKQWRSENSSTRNEEDMYQSVMSNFERRCGILQSENSSLRELLADVQHELVELSASGNVSSPIKSSNKEQLQLPVELIHQRLTESLRQACSKLKKKITTHCASENILSSTFTVDSETEPLVSNSNADVSISLLEEQEKLSKERSSFYQQKAKFEQEKLSLTESSLKLQRERKKFEEMTRGLTPVPITEALLSLSPRANKSPGRSSREQEHINQIKLAVEHSNSAAHNGV